MLAVILLLLLAVIFGAVGFAVHILWIVAVVLLAIWLVGWLFGAAEAGSRRRWYGRW